MPPNRRRALTLVFVLCCLFASLSAAAQEAEIPRPEEIGDLDAPAETLQIQTPTEGERVQTPFAVNGLAPPGARLEIWVGDALDRVFMADASGRFTSAVSRAAPGEKIWVHQVDGQGKRLQSVGVAVVWGGAATPLPAQQADSSAQEPVGGIDPFTPAPVTTTAGGLPQVADLAGEAGSGAPTPPPPSDDPFAETSVVVPAAELDATEEPVFVGRRPFSPGRGLRGTLEATAGLGGAIALGAGGALLGFVIALPSGDFYALLGAAALGGLAGWVVGIPLGVAVSGHLMDANGKWWAAVLGELGGFLVAGLVAEAARYGDGTALTFSIVSMPIIGAVIGYELTSDRSAFDAKAQKRGLQTLRPTLRPTADGGFALGVGLQF